MKILETDPHIENEWDCGKEISGSKSETEAIKNKWAAINPFSF